MNRLFFCSALFLAACGRPALEERGGGLSVAITQAPSDANCITVTVTGANRVATRQQQALAPWRLAWDNTQGSQIFVTDLNGQTVRKLQ